MAKPAKDTKELTPMQRQYNEIKEANQDCILFFRLGDFYEMFNEDAKLAARELDLTLTTRDRGKPRKSRPPCAVFPTTVWIPTLQDWSRRATKSPSVSR